MKCELAAAYELRCSFHTKMFGVFMSAASQLQSVEWGRSMSRLVGLDVTNKTMTKMEEFERQLLDTHESTRRRCVCIV